MTITITRHDGSEFILTEAQSPRFVDVLSFDWDGESMILELVYQDENERKVEHFHSAEFSKLVITQ